MPTLREISITAADPDLADRLVSAAAEKGILNPRVWVTENMRQLAAAPCTPDPGAQKIADVYAYASLFREQAITAANIPAAPGRDEAAVTDAHLRNAVESVQNGF